MASFKNGAPVAIRSVKGYGPFLRKYSAWAKQVGSIGSTSEFKLFKNEDGTYTISTMDEKNFLYSYCYYWRWGTSQSAATKLLINYVEG